MSWCLIVSTNTFASKFDVLVESNQNSFDIALPVTDIEIHPIPNYTAVLENETTWTPSEEEEARKKFNYTYVEETNIPVVFTPTANERSLQTSLINTTSNQFRPNWRFGTHHTENGKLQLDISLKTDQDIPAGGLTLHFCLAIDCSSELYTWEPRFQRYVLGKTLEPLKKNGEHIIMLDLLVPPALWESTLSGISETAPLQTTLRVWYGNQSPQDLVDVKISATPNNTAVINDMPPLSYTESQLLEAWTENKGVTDVSAESSKTAIHPSHENRILNTVEEYPFDPSHVVSADLLTYYPQWIPIGIDPIIFIPLVDEDDQVFWAQIEEKYHYVAMRYAEFYGYDKNDAFVNLENPNEPYIYIRDREDEKLIIHPDFLEVAYERYHNEEMIFKDLAYEYLQAKGKTGRVYFNVAEDLTVYPERTDSEKRELLVELIGESQVQTLEGDGTIGEVYLEMTHSFPTENTLEDTKIKIVDESGIELYSGSGKELFYLNQFYQDFYADYQTLARHIAHYKGWASWTMSLDIFGSAKEPIPGSETDVQAWGIPQLTVTNAANSTQVFQQAIHSYEVGPILQKYVLYEKDIQELAKQNLGVFGRIAGGGVDFFSNPDSLTLKFFLIYPDVYQSDGTTITEGSGNRILFEHPNFTSINEVQTYLDWYKDVKADYEDFAHKVFQDATLRQIPWYAFVDNKEPPLQVFYYTDSFQSESFSISVGLAMENYLENFEANNAKYRELATKLVKYDHLIDGGTYQFSFVKPDNTLQIYYEKDDVLQVATFENIDNVAPKYDDYITIVEYFLNSKTAHLSDEKIDAQYETHQVVGLETFTIERTLEGVQSSFIIENCTEVKISINSEGDATYHPTCGNTTNNFTIADDAGQAAVIRTAFLRVSNLAKEMTEFVDDESEYFVSIKEDTINVFLKMAPAYNDQLTTMATENFQEWGRYEMEVSAEQAGLYYLFSFPVDKIDNINYMYSILGQPYSTYGKKDTYDLGQASYDPLKRINDAYYEYDVTKSENEEVCQSVIVEEGHFEIDYDNTCSGSPFGYPYDIVINCLPEVIWVPEETVIECHTSTTTSTERHTARLPENLKIHNKNWDYNAIPDFTIEPSLGADGHPFIVVNKDTSSSNIHWQPTYWETDEEYGVSVHTGRIEAAKSAVVFDERYGRFQITKKVLDKLSVEGWLPGISYAQLDDLENIIYFSESDFRDAVIQQIGGGMFETTNKVVEYSKIGIWTKRAGFAETRMVLYEEADDYFTYNDIYEVLRVINFRNFPDKFVDVKHQSIDPTDAEETTTITVVVRDPNATVTEVVATYEVKNSILFKFHQIAENLGYGGHIDNELRAYQGKIVKDVDEFAKNAKIILGEIKEQVRQLKETMHPENHIDFPLQSNSDMVGNRTLGASYQFGGGMDLSYRGVYAEASGDVTAHILHNGIKLVEGYGLYQRGLELAEMVNTVNQQFIYPLNRTLALTEGTIDRTEGYVKSLQAGLQPYFDAAGMVSKKEYNRDLDSIYDAMFEQYGLSFDKSSDTIDQVTGSAKTLLTLLRDHSKKNFYPDTLGGVNNPNNNVSDATTIELILSNIPESEWDKYLVLEEDVDPDATPLSNILNELKTYIEETNNDIEAINDEIHNTSEENERLAQNNGYTPITDYEKRMEVGFYARGIDSHFLPIIVEECHKQKGDSGFQKLKIQECFAIDEFYLPTEEEIHGGYDTPSNGVSVTVGAGQVEVSAEATIIVSNSTIFISGVTLPGFGSMSVEIPLINFQAIVADYLLGLPELTINDFETEVSIGDIDLVNELIGEISMNDIDLSGVTISFGSGSVTIEGIRLINITPDGRPAPYGGRPGSSPGVDIGLPGLLELPDFSGITVSSTVFDNVFFDDFQQLIVDHLNSSDIESSIDNHPGYVWDGPQGEAGLPGLYEATTWGYEQPMVLIIVPVILEAGALAEAGIEWSFDIRKGIHGKVTPFARVSAYAAATATLNYKTILEKILRVSGSIISLVERFVGNILDSLSFEFGIRGEVDLINNRTPLTASAVPIVEKHTVKLETYIDVYNRLKGLEGRMYTLMRWKEPRIKNKCWRIPFGGKICIPVGIKWKAKERRDNIHGWPAPIDIVTPLYHDEQTHKLIHFIHDVR